MSERFVYKDKCFAYERIRERRRHESREAFLYGYLAIEAGVADILRRHKLVLTKAALEALEARFA